MLGEDGGAMTWEELVDEFRTQKEGVCVLHEMRMEIPSQSGGILNKWARSYYEFDVKDLQMLWRSSPPQGWDGFDSHRALRLAFAACDVQKADVLGRERLSELLKYVCYYHVLAGQLVDADEKTAVWLARTECRDLSWDEFEAWFVDHQIYARRTARGEQPWLDEDDQREAQPRRSSPHRNSPAASSPGSRSSPLESLRRPGYRAQRRQAENNEDDDESLQAGDSPRSAIDEFEAKAAEFASKAAVIEADVKNAELETELEKQKRLVEELREQMMRQQQEQMEEMRQMRDEMRRGHSSAPAPAPAGLKGADLLSHIGSLGGGSDDESEEESGEEEERAAEEAARPTKKKHRRSVDHGLGRHTSNTPDPRHSSPTPQRPAAAEALAAQRAAEAAVAQRTQAAAAAAAAAAAQRAEEAEDEAHRAAEQRLADDAAQRETEAARTVAEEAVREEDMEREREIWLQRDAMDGGKSAALLQSFGGSDMGDSTDLLGDDNDDDATDDDGEEEESEEDEAEEDDSDSDDDDMGGVELEMYLAEKGHLGFSMDEGPNLDWTVTGISDDDGPNQLDVEMAELAVGNVLIRAGKKAGQEETIAGKSFAQVTKLLTARPINLIFAPPSKKNRKKHKKKRKKKKTKEPKVLAADVDDDAGGDGAFTLAPPTEPFSAQPAQPALAARPTKKKLGDRGRPSRVDHGLGRHTSKTPDPRNSSPTPQRPVAADAAAEAAAVQHAAETATVDRARAADARAEAAAAGPAAAKAPAPQTLTMPDKAGRAALFGECDVNGNGGLSLAEIDKAIHEGTIGRAMNCPDFDHKPAIMRAYKAADTSGDELIERSEFYKLLKYLVYFNNLWLKFEEIDSDHDRRMDIDEFAKGCEIIGVTLSAEEAAAEFHKCAADGGSHILFGEFCTWCAKRHTLDLEMTGARVEAAAAAGRAEAEAAEAADAAGGDFEGSLDIYLASGKKKHARYFWLEGTKLCWDKERKTGKAGKTRRKSGKSEQLIAVNGALEIKSAKEWFQQIDANNSGQLDADELAELYKLARGEKLKYKDLSKAMAEMDSDGSGTCDLEEFERWWSANGK